MLARELTRDDSAVAEGVRCVWCGEPASASGGRLAFCSNCGAASTYPPPDDAELQAAYADWYRPNSGRFSAGGDLVLGISRAALARRLDRIAPPGPVLDVGAGDGSLLGAFHARGREAVGLERESSRAGIVACELQEFDDRIGEWAAVVFWHSLEHLRDPRTALDQAARLLAHGGVLAIAVPNLASWQARCFGRHWFHLDLPRHLVHLPVATLRSGVEARGFHVERCSHWRGGQLVFGWLYGMTRALPGHHDLYSAIRRPQARNTEISGPRRALTLVAAPVLFPVAALLVAVEVTAHAGGTVYLEARKS